MLKKKVIMNFIVQSGDQGGYPFRSPYKERRELFGKPYIICNTLFYIHSEEFLLDLPLIALCT